MVCTIICEVGTIMCNIDTINVRFYLLEIPYPHDPLDLCSFRQKTKYLEDLKGIITQYLEDLKGIMALRLPSLSKALLKIILFIAPYHNIFASHFS